MYYDQMSKLFQDNLNKSNAQILTEEGLILPTCDTQTERKNSVWLSNIHKAVQQFSPNCTKTTLNNVYAILFEIYRSVDPVIVRSISDIRISKSKFGMVIEIPSYGLYCDFMSDEVELLMVGNKITSEKILRLKDVLPRVKKELMR